MLNTLTCTHENVSRESYMYARIYIAIDCGGEGRKEKEQNGGFSISVILIKI